jgi:hypothetical protein
MLAMPVNGDIDERCMIAHILINFDIASEILQGAQIGYKNPYEQSSGMLLL